MGSKLLFCVPELMNTPPRQMWGASLSQSSYHLSCQINVFRSLFRHCCLKVWAGGTERGWEGDTVTTTQGANLEVAATFFKTPTDQLWLQKKRQMSPVFRRV